MQQAARPFQMFEPVRMPTMDRASTTSMNCSPKPIFRIIGLAKNTANDRMKAPKMPPNMDEMNAADRARVPSPRFDIGNPSKTVAWEPDVPGIPMRTEGKVSDVVVTAVRPIIMASAVFGSMPKTNGNSSARPAVPPRPGNTPTTRPITTPATNARNVSGDVNCARADTAASNIWAPQVCPLSQTKACFFLERV